jgi:hypothetical protein
MRYLLGLILLIASCVIVYLYFALALPPAIALIVAIAVGFAEIMVLIFGAGSAHAKGTTLKMFGWLIRVMAPLLCWPAAVLVVRMAAPDTPQWQATISPILGAGVASLAALIAGGAGSGTGGEQVRLWSIIAALLVALLAGLIYLPYGWRLEAAAWSTTAALAIVVARRGLVLPCRQRQVLDAFAIAAIGGMALNLAAHGM